MTVRYAPPVEYVTARGKTASLSAPEGDWPWPEWQGYDSRDWLNLGWMPMPRGRWGWARYHWLHGRLMGYPLVSVLAFVARQLAGNTELGHGPQPPGKPSTGSMSDG